MAAPGAKITATSTLLLTSRAARSAAEAAPYSVAKAAPGDARAAAPDAPIAAPAPVFSIVIVSYRCLPDLLACLQSVAAETTGDAGHLAASQVEVIVVDNDSKDHTAETLHSAPQATRFLEMPANCGFAAAVNTGVRFSSGRYILLLNPDAQLLPGCLRELADRLDRDKSIGIAGARVINPDGSLQLPCRRALPSPLASVIALLGLPQLFPGHFVPYELPVPADWRDPRLHAPRPPREPEPVGAVSGAAMVIRREVLADVGYLDDGFFIFGEDLDYCFRAGNAGWRVVSIPHAFVVHKRGVSRGARPIASIRAGHDAMARYFRKHLLRRRSRFAGALVLAAIRLRQEALVMLARRRLARQDRSAAPRFSESDRA
ncbi:MAG: glycosyltransferase family 2 protein [Candidatus Schekmanbacteria bacterium]|nr:glycosyltransferase family 2 protein [Candidatus Schekmanbacteria bacterium]